MDDKNNSVMLDMFQKSLLVAASVLTACSMSPALAKANATGRLCKGFLTGPGTISYPDYRNSFPDDRYCEWDINIDAAVYGILLEFTHLVTKPGYEFVIVQDRNTQYRLENSMVVTFASVAWRTGAGFSAQITAVSNASLCGGTFWGSGTISSPSYSNSYPNRANCTWILNANAIGDGILLEFTNFLTEPNRDIVRISDGRTQLSYNGGSFSSNPVLSLGRRVVVTFTSDFSMTDVGFSAQFATVSNGSLCGGAFWGSGTISSPLHLNEYPDIINCTWMLHANANGDGILLEFTHFETGFDFVDVIDGRARLRHSGSLPSPYVLRLDKRVVVTFTSENRPSSTKKRFSSRFTTVSTESLCGGTFWGSGTISSPGYPNSYPHNANCTWILNANAIGDGILLEFTNFSTEPGNDLVHVSDGRMQLSYKGSLSSTAVLRLGRRVVVTFTSDSSKTDAGFSAQFATVYVITEATATMSTAIIAAIAASGSVIITASVILMFWLGKRKMSLWQAERKANRTDTKEAPAELLLRPITGSGAGNDESVHDSRTRANVPEGSASHPIASEIILGESTYATLGSQQRDHIYVSLQM